MSTLYATALLLLFLASFCLPSLLYAQEQAPQEPVYRVETTEGQVVLGTVISKSDTEVVLETRELGEVTLSRSDIRKMEEINPEHIRNGEYWHPNPQSTRYLFAPNAIGLPKGRGYYQNTWIFLNNVNYGATNNFSVGVGMIPTFLLGPSAVPVWVMPKVSFSTPQENLHLAGGAVIGGVFGRGGGGTAGLFYGSSTVGSRDRNVTLGMAYGYTGDGFSDAPAVNVSGMLRVGRTAYLITENYLFPAVDEANLVAVGFRWAPENFAVDFALARPLVEEEVGLVAFPWLGVTIPFGR